MKYLRFFAFALVCVLLCCEFACLPSHESHFSRNHLLRSSASDLKSTIVVPHTGEPFDSDKNIIWCSTFQLVWNEICHLIGEDIRFQQNPHFAELMNKRTAKRTDLDEKSFVAMAGRIRDNIQLRINAELFRKFKGAATPRLIPQGSVYTPNDIIAYAYLFKDLRFPKKFEKLNKPICFANSRVSCFGIGETSKKGHINMCRQVLIHDYNNSEDFIIELLTKSRTDQVILARIDHGDTLGSTITNVLERINGNDPLKMQPGDILKVPKFNFDIHRKYDEFIGQMLRIDKPMTAQGLTVISADQQIRFQMDEEGVKLLSESSMSFGCSATCQPPPKHIMIFNKPFLVLMKNKQSNTPYFAMWITNPELLVPWK